MTGGTASIAVRLIVSSPEEATNFEERRTRTNKIPETPGLVGPDLRAGRSEEAD
jgi:hypothetical protein